MANYFKTQVLYQTVPSKDEDKLGLGANHEPESFWIDAVIDLELVSNFQDCAQNKNLFDQPDYNEFTSKATLIYINGSDNTINVPFPEFCKIMGVE